MSILIRGVEMPTSCRACQLKMNCDDCEGLECVCVPLHQQIGFLYDLLTDKRRDDCPLIEVPKPHGRLIDADALKVSLTYAKETAKWPVPLLRTVLIIVDKMPTIIPASEEDD